MVMDPGINGRETYEPISRMYPGQKALIVSGFAVNDEIRTALSVGVSAFLKKPYTMRSFPNTAPHPLLLTARSQFNDQWVKTSHRDRTVITIVCSKERRLIS